MTMDSRLRGNDEHKLSAYSSYKDSGVTWLGDVPAHWRMYRLKELASIQNSNVDKKSHKNEAPVLLCNYVDVYKNDFITESLDFMKATANESEIQRFEIKKDDVLITKDSETCDDIAIPALCIESLEGVLCGYHLAQFRTNKKLLSGTYLFRLFQSESYGFRFVVSAKGITRVGLGQSAIADSLTPIPPLDEQGKIANYLNTKTTQIDRKIELLSQKAGKYSKLKQSLINETVTRGLDKSVLMKDSGIEWIGDVPEHWEVKRIKDFMTVNPITKIPTALSEDDLIEFIPMTNIDDVLGKVKNLTYVKLSEVSTGYTKFRNDDVIFAKITPCMENGNCAIVTGLTHNICFGSTEFMVFRASNKLTSKYLHYFLPNELFRKNAESFMKGTAGQKRISSHFMETHTFALPLLEEQKRITSYLDEKVGNIDRIIETVSSQINNLKELRKTLINDVVTGKIRVVENDN